jgi:hypothetical protein
MVVEFDPLTSLRMFVSRVLELTHNDGHKGRAWELRKDDGTLLDQDENPTSYRLKEGDRLYVTPMIGAGGSVALPDELVIDCGRCGVFVVVGPDEPGTRCPRCDFSRQYMEAEEVVGGPGRSGVRIDMTLSPVAIAKLPRFPRPEFRDFYEYARRSA